MRVTGIIHHGPNGSKTGGAIIQFRTLSGRFVRQTYLGGKIVSTEIFDNNELESVVY